jgi:uncharacterized membrane-anchored protein YitT (DUF2179 family)
VINSFIPVISVGIFSVVVNVPLFLAGYRFVGRKFFIGSLVGMLLSSVLIDVFALLPEVPTEPLLGAIYGGLLVGVGCGIVFMQGASTGGVDIIARLLKFKFRNLSIGKLTLAVDLIIAVITGIAFRDINKILYCIVALFVSSEALDAVVYRFDYSYVAMIITDQDEAIRDAISQRLDRGCTYLKGEGSYTGQKKNVIYCAVKKQQLAEIQELVMETDPSAFLVLQEAHQVLGEGFERYSKHKL